MDKSNLNSDNILEKLSAIVGERDTAPELLAEKFKDIVDWDAVIEHQKILKNSLHRNISIQSALLDYLLSLKVTSSETHPIQAQDISEGKKATYSSIIDKLTGLYNNRHFQTLLNAELKKASKYNFPLTIIILDADNFGMYTALYGHETGDIALKEIALRLKNSCRKEDLVFHLKKNRFAILLLGINRDGAHKLSERLNKNIEQFHFKGEEKLPSKKLTISGGISIFPEDGKNPHTLTMAAEEAIETAKQSGKNKILEYSSKRRSATRVEFNKEAKYFVEGRKDLKPEKVQIINISEKGALIKSNKNLPIAGNILIKFNLPNKTLVKAKGEIVRISKKEGSKESFAAIKFNEINPSDLESLKEFINNSSQN